MPITIVDSGPDKPSKGLGEQCATPSECSSAQCVEGVCCDQACGDACFTCKNPGTEGICLPALPGTDPGDRCPTEDATSCGTTGVCDGTGACARYSGNAGVVCAAEACVGFMRTTTGTCDSAGGCSGASTQSCTPYQCASGGQTCQISCTTDADCAAPNTCMASSCGKKPLGAACGAGAECNSAICAQGGAARRPARELAGRVRWPAAKAPAEVCPTASTPSGSAPIRGGVLRSRRDLRRNGRCRKYVAGSVVRGGFVQGGRRHPGACSDAWRSAAPGSLDCSPYVCGATDCMTRCASSATASRCSRASARLQQL